MRVGKEGGDFMLSDMNLSHLMHTSIEGPNLESVNFKTNFQMKYITITLGMLLGRLSPFPYMKPWPTVPYRKVLHLSSVIGGGSEAPCLLFSIA